MTRFSRNLTLSALFLTLAFSCPIAAQEPPFQDGEYANLILNFRHLVKADLLHARMEVSREDNDYRAVITANTTRFWDSIYSVSDTFSCRFTPDVRPVDFIRNVHEGDYWARALCTWNEDASLLRLQGDKRNRPHRDTTYTDPVMIRDLINVIFHLRTVDPDELMEPKPYLMIVDKDLIDLKLRFVGREVKKIPGLGRCRTLKFAATMSTRLAGDEEDEHTVGGNSNEKERLFFWLSDDENRLMVYFTMPISVGTINGRTVSFGGLKYPFTALEE